MQLGVAAEEFERMIRAFAPRRSQLRGNARTIAITPGKLSKLRKAMSTVLFSPSTRAEIREEAAAEILTGFVTAALEHNETPSNHCLHRASGQRARNRAMEYIEAHLGETIRIVDLCSIAGTTVRSLERTFARELGMSPQQYVKSRRLNAVYRCLREADKEQGLRVVDVATRYGFAHMGRFAGDYHHYFGEYPRETLLAG